MGSLITPSGIPSLFPFPSFFPSPSPQNADVFFSPSPISSALAGSFGRRNVAVDTESGDQEQHYWKKEARRLPPLLSPFSLSCSCYSLFPSRSQCANPAFATLEEVKPESGNIAGRCASTPACLSLFCLLFFSPPPFFQSEVLFFPLLFPYPHDVYTALGILNLAVVYDWKGRTQIWQFIVIRGRPVPFFLPPRTTFDFFPPPFFLFFLLRIDLSIDRQKRI